MDDTLRAEYSRTHPHILGDAFLPKHQGQEPLVRLKDFRLVFGETLSASRVKSIHDCLDRLVAARDLRDFKTPEEIVSNFPSLADTAKKYVLIHTIPLFNQAYHSRLERADNNEILTAVPGKYGASLNLDETVLNVMLGCEPMLQADLERLYFKARDLSLPEIRSKINSIATFNYRLNAFLHGRIPEDLGLGYRKNKESGAAENSNINIQISFDDKKLKLELVRKVIEQACGCKINLFLRYAKNKDLINITFRKRQVTVHEDVLKLKTPEMEALVDFALSHARYQSTYISKSEELKASGAFVKNAVRLCCDVSRLKYLYSAVKKLGEIGWDVSELKSYLSRVRRLPEELSPLRMLDTVTKNTAIVLSSPSDLKKWLVNFSKAVLDNNNFTKLVSSGDLDSGVSKLLAINSDYGSRKFHNSFMREHAGTVFLMPFLPEGVFTEIFSSLTSLYHFGEETHSINQSITHLLERKGRSSQEKSVSTSNVSLHNYRRFEGGLEVLQAFLVSSSKVEKFLSSLMTPEKVLLLTELGSRRDYLTGGGENDIVSWMINNSVKSCDDILSTSLFSSNFFKLLGSIFEPIESERQHVKRVNSELKKLKEMVLPDWILGVVPLLNSNDHQSALTFLEQNKGSLQSYLRDFPIRNALSEARIYVEFLLGCEPSLNITPGSYLKKHAIDVIRKSSKFAFGVPGAIAIYAPKTFEAAARYLIFHGIEESKDLIAKKLDEAINEGANYTLRLSAFINQYAVSKQDGSYSTNCLKLVLINEFFTASPKGFFTPSKLIEFIRSYPSEVVRGIASKVYEGKDGVIRLCLKLRGSPYEELLSHLIDPALIHDAIKDLNTEQLRDFLRGFDSAARNQMTTVFGSNKRRAVNERERYESQIQNLPKELVCLSTSEELPNYLAILGLPRSHTNEQLGESYRQLARIYHPDAFMQEGKDQVDLAKERQKEISEAFEILNDSDKKNVYYRKIPNNAQYYPQRVWFRQGN